MPALAEDHTDHEIPQLRADLYGLLGTLLGRPPEGALLAALCGLSVDGGDNPIERTVAELVAVARDADPDELRSTYTALFIGVGRGEVVPFASWYAGGFVLDTPLARLRTTLATLGFEREEGVHEPEDHIAALCEVMAHLVTDAGREGLELQRDFFNQHLLPWAARFFQDVQNAQSADAFYCLVGRLGEQLITSEKQYLEAVI